ncbi:MAG TPA: DUF1566 domain-containing protein [Candidatus Nanoarchaeia archaeon]|nr:DUF1566 domain-containing protein [Candidatus Nanoarchaeia archaeon]
MSLLSRIAKQIKRTKDWAAVQKVKVSNYLTMAMLGANLNCGSLNEKDCQYDADCSGGEICSLAQLCIPKDECRVDYDCTSERCSLDRSCMEEREECHVDRDCGESLEALCEQGLCNNVVVIADNTRLPENDPAFRSVEVRENELYFIFSRPAGQINIQAGNIVVGSSSGGYLRRVESVELDGNSLLAYTTQASLTDAIQEGRLRGTISFEQSNKSTLPSEYAVRESSLTSDFSGTVLFNQRTDTGQGLEIRISRGTLSFTPDLDLDVSISLFRINRFSAIASGAIDLDIDVEANIGGRLEASREVEIGLPYVQPFAFSIGPVPVVGVASLQLYAGFEAHGELAGQVTVGFDCSASLEFGAEYFNGNWTEIWNPGLDCNAHSPELGIQGSTGLEIYLRPELKIMVYGVAGPALDVKPYLSWEGNFSSFSDWFWEITAGISSHLGYRLEVFGRGIDRSFELFDWRTVIASDSSGGPTCNDGCSTRGETRCSGDSIESCLPDHDSDACLEWGHDRDCGSDEHCDNERCVPDTTACTDQCSPAGNYCSGNDVRICARGTDGCLDSGYVTTCADGCSGGICNDAPADRFVDMGDGTVRDTVTGKFWLWDTNPSIYDTGDRIRYSTAAGFCGGTSTGGREWRVPSLEELREFCQTGVPCNGESVFAGYCNWDYWSSTTSGSGIRSVVMIDTRHTCTDSTANERDFIGAVRCISD